MKCLCYVFYTRNVLKFSLDRKVLAIQYNITVLLKHELKELYIYAKGKPESGCLLLAGTRTDQKQKICSE